MTRDLAFEQAAAATRVRSAVSFRVEACRLRSRSTRALAGRRAFSHQAPVPPLWIQGLPDLGVAPVDVGAKLQLAVDIRERGLVHHEHRHGLRQGAVGWWCRSRSPDRWHRPVAASAGRPACRGILHPDAAMTDAAVVAAEQVLRRGIVQVNVEPVVHLEHQLPEARVGARQLLQPAVGQQDHVALRQIVRVAAGLRQDLLRWRCRSGCSRAG